MILYLNVFDFLSYTYTYHMGHNTSRCCIMRNRGATQDSNYCYRGAQQHHGLCPDMVSSGVSGWSELTKRVVLSIQNGGFNHRK